MLSLPRLSLSCRRHGASNACPEGWGSGGGGRWVEGRAFMEAEPAASPHAFPEQPLKSTLLPTGSNMGDAMSWRS